MSDEERRLHITREIADAYFKPRWNNEVYVPAQVEDLIGGVFKVVESDIRHAVKLVRDDGALFWLEAEDDGLIYVTTLGEDD